MGVLSDTEKLIVNCTIMRLREEEALDYLRMNGHAMSRRTFYRIKRRVEEKKLARLYEIAKIGFVSQHIERIDQLELIQRGLTTFRLPYWDWANDQTIPDWVPLPTGVQRVPGADPRGTATLPVQSQVDPLLFNEHSYDLFTLRLETLHNAVHTWVGGDMWNVPTAVRDPIFWLHHANIDRYWNIWQTHNPTQLPPLTFPNNIMDPYVDSSDYANNTWNYFYYYR